MAEIFTEIVKRHFSFLLTNYNFKIGEEFQSNDRFDSGIVIYKSDRYDISIKKDGSDLLVNIKPTNEPDFTSLSLKSISDLLDIHGYKHYRFIAPWQYDEAMAIYSITVKKALDILLSTSEKKWVDILRVYSNKEKKEYFQATGKKLPEGAFQSLDKYIKEKTGTNNMK